MDNCETLPLELFITVDGKPVRPWLTAWMDKEKAIKRICSPYLPWSKKDQSSEPDVDYREILKHTQNSED